LLLIIAFVSGCSQIDTASTAIEVQITFDPKNHDLDKCDNFSPGDKWLVYDTRTWATGIGGNSNIEKVNVETGEIVRLYKTPNQTEYGPGCGAPSYSPVENKVVFIRGPANADAERPYGFFRRTGVVVDESRPGKLVFLDARDVTPPFTPGALRGGTHRHEFSGDGKWVGFTYNDAVMAELEKRTGRKMDLRTIGVATSIRPVTVDKDGNGENNDGIWFSALVVKVTANPKPGSDQISRAFSDSWVGTKGYRKPDGTWQRARAFLGNVRDKDGKELTEVFIVDIPDRIDIAGDDGPLEGTAACLPMPPKGAHQRRLTRTQDRKYPGVATIVRHWVRSSPDGSRIVYLAKDDRGIIQVFLVSPLGGDPVQVTRGDNPIQSTVRWNPNGREIAYVCDNSICICSVEKGASFGKAMRMTPKTDEPPLSPVWSHDGRTIAYNRLVRHGEKSYCQIFIVKLK